MILANLKTSRQYSGQVPGQSLVEFVLVAPLLLIIMVAGALVGLAMYQGNLSSEAIKEPALHKQEMAATVGSVSNGTLLGYTSQGAKGLLPSSGAPLDSLRQVNINDRVTVLVGTKNYRPPMGGLLPNLSFDFSVSNAIQRKLLEPMNQGGAAGGGGPVQRSANDIPARTPPWEIEGFKPTFGGCAPPSGPINVSSAGGTVLANASKTYISAVNWTKQSSLDVETIYDLAQQYMGECAGQGAGICAAENARLQPSVHDGDNRRCTPPCGGGHCSIRCLTTYNNPPGAPGMRVSIAIEIVPAEVESTTDPATGEVTKTETAPANAKPPEITATVVDGFGGEHGMYFDPSGKYERPPGDFVDSCTKIKQGECALSKAVDRSGELSARLTEECKP